MAGDGTNMELYLFHLTVYGTKVGRGGGSNDGLRRVRTTGERGNVALKETHIAALDKSEQKFRRWHLKSDCEAGQQAYSHHEHAEHRTREDCQRCPPSAGPRLGPGRRLDLPVSGGLVLIKQTVVFRLGPQP